MLVVFILHFPLSQKKDSEFQKSTTTRIFGIKVQWMFSISPSVVSTSVMDDGLSSNAGDDENAAGMSGKTCHISRSGPLG